MSGRKNYIAILFPALLLAAGCYGGKMIKMPINAELAYRQVDTLRARQDEIIHVLNEITAMLKEEREATLHRRVETQTTLDEIETSLMILSSKVDANTQLLASVYGNANKKITSPITVLPRDTIPNEAGGEQVRDTLSTLPPSLRDDADGLYRAAYMDLTLGNYDLAIQGFKNYLMKFPSGAKLPEVHYYLGESYYASGRHLEAVGEFQYVVREFPSSRLVPASFLKSGICYANLEERTLAERAFRELISQFPDTEEAQRARLALEDLEG